jgi:hypothetical protein
MATKKRSTKSGSTLLGQLRQHLRSKPATLPVVEQEFAGYERPNFQLALDELLGGLPEPSRLMGVIAHMDHDIPRLTRLAHERAARQYALGPVAYVDVPLADGKHLACVKGGLFFLRDRGGPLAMLVGENLYNYGNFFVEVMAGERGHAEEFLRKLTRTARLGYAFSGRVLSVEEDCRGRLSVNFHQLPAIDREGLILPAPLLERIERHTLSFSRHAEKLRQAGRHLKRGILLHGPPGTGKTLSAMYLAAQMPGRTVFLMTGGSVRALESACKLARMLTPATIIVEDVDLIGTERQRQSVSANVLLFELLNQMDGLADDTDLLFVLTTNRPDILEPALAARPGRIDQAIEVPPPDADCRRRLLELYGRSLTFDGVGWDALIQRTAGVSGAFIRELLRKAAVFAAEQAVDGELVVRDGHLEEALAELLVAGGPLTQSLLGAARSQHACHAD